MSITISGDGDINATGNDIELNSTGTTDVTLAVGGGSVGIGTATPNDLLEISGDTAQPAIRLTDEDVAGLYHRIFTPTNTGLAISADAGNVAASSFLRFDVDDTERARIDSSGNLLVGKTAQNSDNAGVELRPGGQTTATKSASWVGLFNRLSDDGDLVRFQKDSTLIGSLGSSAGNSIYIGTSNVAVRFSNVNNAIYPTTTAGLNRDDATDLGISTVRFRNAYLSGGVYLGGTGSANLLDDYEEGTWTPVDNSPAGLTFSSVSGATYVKVGNLIRVTASVTYPTTSDTNRVAIAGFPVSSASGSTNGGFIHYTDNGTIPNLNMGASSTSLSCYTASGGVFSNATMSGKRIDFTMIYQTA